MFHRYFQWQWGCSGAPHDALTLLLMEQSRTATTTLAMCWLRWLGACLYGERFVWRHHICSCSVRARLLLCVATAAHGVCTRSLVRTKNRAESSIGQHRILDEFVFVYLLYFILFYLEHDCHKCAVMSLRYFRLSALSGCLLGCQCMTQNRLKWWVKQATTNYSSFTKSNATDGEPSTLSLFSLKEHKN